MMNYKVRVFSKKESDCLQDFLKSHGYTKPYNNFILHDGFVCVNKQCQILCVCISQAGNEIDEFENITIPQLRDKVVLHRNDVHDANCKDDTLHDLYIDSNKVVYFYHHGELKWVESAINRHDVYLNIVKPIEKEEMKEYLNPLKDGGYELIIPTIIGCADRDWIEVPEGAEQLYKFYDGVEFQRNGHSEYYDHEDEMWVARGNTDLDMDHIKVLWQRNPPVDAEFNTEKAIAESELMVRENSKHSHYFKDVSGLTSIDVYKVLQLFEVIDPCLQHIVKKALCAGQRGHKDFKKDIQDILDTAKRCVEIN